MFADTGTWEWAGTQKYLDGLGHKSLGLCAHYVRLAIVHGGIQINGTNYAKDLGPNLFAKGFMSVYKGNKLKTFPLRRGDVAVINGFVADRTVSAQYKDKPLYHPGADGKQHLVPHTAGHAAIYDGTHWYSDYRQKDTKSPYPGDEYQSVKPNFSIYRYTGFIRPALQDAVMSLAAALGLPLAPVVQNGLTTAVKFLNLDRDLLSREMCWHLKLGIGMGIAEPEKAENYVEIYLRGIDFHSTVIVTTLKPGTLLSRHEWQPDEAMKRPSNCDLKDHFPTFRKPFIFFTKPGVSPLQTGTSFPVSRFREFEVMRIVRALQSTAAGIRFTQPGRADIVRSGGGVQFILKNADANALVVKQVSSVKSRNVDRPSSTNVNYRPFS